jgi:hypothetical protein
MIADAPWYVPNMVFQQDLQITSVKEEIHRFSTQYRDRLYTHPNNLTVPKGHIQAEGKLKNPVSSTGIEPTTFWLVA